MEVTTDFFRVGSEPPTGCALWITILHKLKYFSTCDGVLHFGASQLPVAYV
jgi:hypothetical protein